MRNICVLFFSFCLLSVFAAGQSSVSYAPVALPDGQSAYAAAPLYSVSAAAEAPSGGGMAELPSSASSFGCTSYLLQQAGSQYSSQVLPVGSNAVMWNNTSSGFPTDPLDPFLNPVGEVPFVLMLLLGSVWALVRRRKTA